MTFLAIVHAPVLRPGARLCICDLEQSFDHAPTSITAGDEIMLRFGTCCPDLADGAIGFCDAEPDEAVLRVADSAWTIRRATTRAVELPGLITEDWFVVDA